MVETREGAKENVRSHNPAQQIRLLPWPRREVIQSVLKSPASNRRAVLRPSRNNSNFKRKTKLNPMHSSLLVACEAFCERETSVGSMGCGLCMKGSLMF
jgi:hypothetical protein